MSTGVEVGNKEDGRKKKRTYGPCRRCVKAKGNLSGPGGPYCYDCLKVVKAEVKAQEADQEKVWAAENEKWEAEQRAVGIPESLIDLRWVARNPGRKAMGMRQNWKEVRDKNVADFMDRLKEAEGEYLLSLQGKEAKEIALARVEDEGLERCMETVDRWIIENANAG